MLGLSSLFSSSKPFDFNGMTDWHSHILPGVDDGVQDLQTSLNILSEYEQMGIKEVWLTPHIMEDVANTPAALKERYQELLAAYQGSINLHLAAENMIDSLFYERLQNNDVLTIGQERNTLLVETTTFSAPIDFEETLVDIKRKGYYPLLAHPERYHYLQTIKEYQKIKDLGVRFQLNLLSLSGFYGKTAKDKAHKMLNNGMYDAIGSDLHRHQQIAHLNKLALDKKSLSRLEELKHSAI